MTRIAESDVENAALEWLAGLGWGVAHGSRPESMSRMNCGIPIGPDTRAIGSRRRHPPEALRCEAMKGGKKYQAPDTAVHYPVRGIIDP